MKGIQRTVKKRRHENRTDYGARLSMLTSERTRLVVRKSNRYVIAQFVVSENAQDKVVAGVSSKDLMEHGWPKDLSGSLKSVPACYLTGLLLGKKAKIKEAILDIGMQRNAAKGRLYAVLRGVIDSGVEVPHNKEVLPNDEQLSSNEETSAAFKKVKEKLK